MEWRRRRFTCTNHRLLEYGIQKNNRSAILERIQDEGESEDSLVLAIKYYAIKFKASDNEEVCLAKEDSVSITKRHVLIEDVKKDSKTTTQKVVSVAGAVGRCLVFPPFTPFEIPATVMTVLHQQQTC